MNPDFNPLTYYFNLSEPAPAIVVPESAESDPEVKQAVRKLLRFGGHKPSGRGRPASESLLKALNDGRFPTIHPVVDFFNVCSLESGLPISVLDGSKIDGSWSFRVGGEEESYIFNPSGQELRLKGLLLVADESGPTGTPVKDAQRTKVADDSNEFLVVVWATTELPELREEVGRRILAWLNERGAKLLS